MKIFKPFYSVFACYATCSLLISCDSYRENNGAQNPMVDKCKELTSNAFRNEVVIQYDECKLETQDESIKEIMASLDSILTPLDTCVCDSTLILYKIDDVLGPEETLAASNDKLRPKGLGNAFFNFNIKLPEVKRFDYIKLEDIKYYELSEEILVAVIDGGIKWGNDSVLEKFMWISNDPGGDPHGYNFTSSSDPDSMSQHGYLIGKLITNNLNSDLLKLMDLRIINNDNEGILFDALCAIKYAIKNEADIMNMSWGFYNQRFDENFKKYIEEAKNHGIIIVASSGNDSIDTDICHHFPSGFDDYQFSSFADNVISVAYLGENKIDLSKHSNFGKKTIALAAPGTFTGFEGSSYATPQITRLASIVKSNRPDLNYRQIVQCIRQQVITTPILPLNTKGRIREGINFNCDPLISDREDEDSYFSFRLNPE